MTTARIPANLIPLPVASGQPSTFLLRRAFELESPREAKLSIYAEGNYHAWVNGRYVGRGPAYHHAGAYPIDHLSTSLQAGANVIAILVYLPGIALHNAVPTTTPYLLVHLGDCDFAIETDEHWRIAPVSGWSSDVPRRSWAIGHVESFDARVAPIGWQEVGFDDSAWPLAKPAPRGTIAGEWFGRPVPNLRFRHVAPTRVTGVFGTDTPPKPLHLADPTPDAGRAILDATWLPAGRAGVDAGNLANGEITVRGLTPGHGAIVCLDLGAQFTGQVAFDCDATSEGVIDVGWAESADGDKPRIVRKGCSYVDRVHARVGRFHWQPAGYSGMRHLLLVLRGFSGEVRFSGLGVLASEPELDWRGAFRCDDERINQIFDLCARTQCVGTQEGVIDCPTREQAPYVGDGLLIARWIASLTGDARHWRYLVDAQFARPNADGLVRGSIFSGSNTGLVDYCLHAIIGLRDYARCSGDTALARKHLDACRRIIAFFEKMPDDSGLCYTEPLRMPQGHVWTAAVDVAHPAPPPTTGTLLFVDHPGMGWHNKGEAGIDRRGTNCAFNALLSMTYAALAELESVTSNPDRAEAALKHAETIRSLVGERFFAPNLGVFSDGSLDGKLLEQRSEQTNTWVIASGACDDNRARAVFSKLLSDPDPTIARAGPYFWAYLFPQLARLGLHKLALEQLRSRWSRMLEHDATLLWETFVGDDLDSMCHPWSGAPLEFLLNHIAGLPGMLDVDPPTLSPRFDLLNECRATAFTRHGQWSIDWKRTGDTVDLSITVPAETVARVRHPNGRMIEAHLAGGKSVRMSVSAT